MQDINFIKEVVERAFDPFSELPAIYAKKEKMVDEYIERSRKAQQIVAGFTQEQVDKLVKAMAMAIYEHAEELGKMAAEETGMGDPEHKVMKNIGKSTGTWAELKGKPSIGVIRTEEENGVIVLAKPMGVLGCVTPTTNPTITPLGKRHVRRQVCQLSRGFPSSAGEEHDDEDGGIHERGDHRSGRSCRSGTVHRQA